MKGKILLFTYAILSCIFIYGRFINDLDLAALAKYFLIVPLIVYYIITVKKIDYKFVMVLALYLLGDILFTLSEYQFGGFGSYLLANLSLSLLILSRLNFFTTKSFFRIITLISLVIIIVLSIFYNNPIFQKIFVWIFHISVGIILLVAYLRHSKITKQFSLLMLLSTLMFIFCNFLANMNYFLINNLFFRILISIFYVLFLLGITHSMVLEDKEEGLEIG